MGVWSAAGPSRRAHTLSVHSRAPVLPPRGLPGGRGHCPVVAAEEASTELGVRRRRSWGHCGRSAQRLSPTAGLQNGHVPASRPEVPPADPRGVGGRPWGGEGHRPSASWHAGDTRARWAGPWLSRTSGGSPSYSRFYLGAPGVSTCSRSIKFNVAAMSALVTDSAKPAGTRAGARGDLGAHPPCGGPARRQRLPGEHEE